MEPALGGESRPSAGLRGERSTRSPRRSEALGLASRPSGLVKEPRSRGLEAGVEASASVRLSAGHERAESRALAAVRDELGVLGGRSESGVSAECSVHAGSRGAAGVVLGRKGTQSVGVAEGRA